jgi:hypothetical protein
MLSREAAAGATTLVTGLLEPHAGRSGSINGSVMNL